MIVLVIPDTHSPFMHKDALDFLSDLKREYKPDKVIHLGDECDAHALSDFDKDPDGFSAGHEYLAAQKQIMGLYRLFPIVQVCESNHSKRPFRRAFKSGIPAAYLKSYREFMHAPPGWSWHEKIMIDNVLYIHGEGFTGKDGAINAAKGHRKSTVVGHIHSHAGVVYLAGSHDQIFGMNTGCLIDESAYAFHYGKHLVNKPVLGAGIVINGKEAFFRPMIK